MSEEPPEPHAPSPENGRRDFFAKAGSICAGCALVGVPVAAGISVVLDPLSHSVADAEFIKVTALDALPEDGTPQKFTIKADKQDAWSRFPNRVIGAVYLRRSGSDAVQAFNVICPHLGCAIEFRGEERDYFCPCHNSAFDLKDGAAEDGSPSARGLDTLETEVRRNGDVWVRFQNFLTGIEEKKPA